MNDKKVIVKHTFRKETRCERCYMKFRSSGWQEKCIVGYTPEGYTYALRNYCETCGKQREEKLAAEGHLYTCQFPGQSEDE